MTFEPWKEGSFLLRFEHILEKDEDPELSQPARFNLFDVFPGYGVELKEVILSANQWMEDSHRLHFNQENEDFLDEFENATKPAASPELEITLNPMEIKTFVMTMYPKV